MSRGAHDRLRDVLNAITAAKTYAKNDAVLRDAMAFDAVRMRIIEIGEAAAELDRAGVAPPTGWRDVIGMRNLLTHHYWPSDAQLVHETVAHDLDVLARDVARLLDELT